MNYKIETIKQTLHIYLFNIYLEWHTVISISVHFTCKRMEKNPGIPDRKKGSIETHEWMNESSTRTYAAIWKYKKEREEEKNNEYIDLNAG